MKVPGSNLLNKAFKLIAKEKALWYKYEGEVENSIGLTVKTYFDPIEVLGSFQPINRDKYEVLGLDYQHTYANFFTSHELFGVDRDYSGDYIVVQGVRYSVMSDTLWFRYDKWTEVMVVKAKLNNA
jgi:hypothetical protein